MKWTRVWMVVGVTFIVGPTWELQAKPNNESWAAWKKLLHKGTAMLAKKEKRHHYAGIRSLLRAHRLAPQRRETLVEACRAYMLLGLLSEKKVLKAKWSQRGRVLAKTLMKRWPKRAEGYNWTAVHIGMYANTTNPLAALFQGVPGKIEAFGKKAVKLNSNLYKGGAHRLLGRYYYKMPWPKKDLKRSLRHLQTSYRLDRSNAFSLLFLAETLLGLKQKSKARRLLQRCSRMPLTTPLTHSGRAPQRSAVLRCRKALRRLR